MKLKTFASLSLFLLIGSFATVQEAPAQIPCGPTIAPLPSLFVNWPQYQFDAAHSGCNPYEFILRPDNVGNLTLDWQNASINVTASPTVADGLVFGSYNDDVHHTGATYALNASTGLVVHKYATGDKVLTAPAVANGKVYLNTNSSFIALDEGTGALLWSYPIFPGFTSPAVANGVVYTVTLSGTVYAVDANTGAQIWQSATGDDGNSSPAVSNGMVYVGSQDNNVYALDAATGALVWKYTTGNQIVSSPAVASGVVYIGSNDGNVYALDAKTGALRWQYPVIFHVACTPAVSRGVVYIGANDGNLYALNASTGALLWKFFASGLVEYAPAVANNVVYFATNSGTAYALNAQTGALLWQHGGSNLSSHAVVANGILYLNGSGMYAFHLPNQ